MLKKDTNNKIVETPQCRILSDLIEECIIFKSSVNDSSELKRVNN